MSGSKSNIFNSDSKMKIKSKTPIHPPKSYVPFYMRIKTHVKLHSCIGLVFKNKTCTAKAAAQFTSHPRYSWLHSYYGAGSVAARVSRTLDLIAVTT